MATAGRKTNWFAIWISVGVVVVLVAVGGLVIWMNNAAAGPGAAPQASNVNQDTGAISFGTGSQTVTTYVDFMCPYCNQFEQTEGETINGLVSDGTITLELQPVALLDRSSQGTKYSSRSAAAMYAVAESDPDNAYAFFKALYANQPQEGTTGLTDEQIVDIARQAGVNVSSDLESAITSGKYIKFAQSHKLPDGATGTPTVLVNGKMIQVTYNPQADIVANLNK
jgi:protein-disulfide isomerase